MRQDHALHGMPVHHRAHTHTTHVTLADLPISMFLGGGKKPGNPEENHSDTGKMFNSNARARAWDKPRHNKTLTER